MSCQIIKNHSRILSRSAVLALMLGVTGCSSDFHRFDQSFYDKAMPTSSEVAAANPYPGDLDPQTTASIGSGNSFVPAVGVGEVRQVIYNTPGTANTSRQTLQQMDNGYRQVSQAPTYVPSGGQPETLQSYGYGVQRAQGSYQQATGYVNNAKTTYNNYQSVNKVVGATDNITTGSISKVNDTVSQARSLVKYNYTEENENTVAAQPAIEKAASGKQTQQEASASKGSGGWSAIGGTRIQISEGETLYNLSKRFGVPVDALMEVNSIDDASNVRAGQSIIVPTYVFSKDNPTSAPDANPKTRASRASTGYLGEATAAKAPVPDKRPNDHVFDNTSTKSEHDGRPWTVEVAKNEEQAEKIDNTVTGSITDSEEKAAPVRKKAASGGKYQVQPGDSLYGISRKTGVSIDAITAANGIQNNIVKLGQWLVIPDGSTPTKPTANARKVEEKTTTAANQSEETKNSVEAKSEKTAKANTENEPKPYVKPEVKKLDETVTASIDENAPERSGFGNWRKPVHGRIISKFGEMRNGSRNDGIDISVPEGTPVKSVENGVVIYSSNELKQFGNLVLIRHNDGFVSAYANLKNYDVEKGETVRRGQIIGRSGRTGQVNQPQLHFELRKNSNPVDPTAYFDAG